MLTITASADGVVFEPRAVGYPVYLDTWALIDLAEGDEARRESFVDCIQSPHSALLFSFANAAEIGGPQGASAEAVRAFVECIGPHWVPLEMNPWTVVEREKPRRHTTAAISEGFIADYFKQRTHELAAEGKIISLHPDDFWRLDAD